jgi:2-polyprenyl-3-methyl-5-hydroxy-6-metoxy-1,4-benzoquinol methylase
MSPYISGRRIRYGVAWWGGYFIDNRLRRLLHDPERLLGPYVTPGMTVLDVGCGMGWFSIPMAKLVGTQGRAPKISRMEPDST